MRITPAKTSRYMPSVIAVNVLTAMAIKDLDFSLPEALRMLHRDHAIAATAKAKETINTTGNKSTIASRPESAGIQYLAVPAATTTLRTNA
jgi:hypothetical protein